MRFLQLDEMLASSGTKIDKVLEMKINDDVLIERATGKYGIRLLFVGVMAVQVA